MEAAMPSLRGLQAFANVARYGSFRRAAERLNISVSAISHRIHALEEEVGLALFERMGRRMRLTRAGEVYRDKVLPLIDALVIATDAAQREGANSSLRISSFQLFYIHWLAPRVSTFLQRQSAVRLEMNSLKHEGFTNDITLRIIRPDEANIEDDFIAPFEISPVCLSSVYGRRAYPSDDIFDEQLILTKTSVNLWKEWACSAGLEWRYPKRFILVDSLPLSIELAAAGQGVAISANLFRSYIERMNMIYPLEQSCSTVGSIYVNRASDWERPVVRFFREWLKTEIASS